MYKNTIATLGALAVTVAVALPATSVAASRAPAPQRAAVLASSGVKSCPPIYLDFREMTVKGVSCATGKKVILKAHSMRFDQPVETIRGFKCTKRAYGDLIKCSKDHNRKWIHFDARE